MTSQDGGQTWLADPRVISLDGVASVPKAISLAVSPTAPETAYAWIMTRAGRRPGITARTIDAGATWHVIDAERLGASPVVDPDPAVVYYLSDEPYVYRMQVSEQGVVRERYAELPDQPRQLALSSDGSRFWVVTRGGSLYRSRHGGAAWEELMDRPEGTSWRVVALNPLAPSLLFPLTDDGRLWAYRAAADDEPGRDTAP